MDKMDLSKLQNGSDVRGVALFEHGGQPVNLTADAAFSIAAAFAQWVKQKTEKKEISVGVGNDSRLTANELKNAIISGLSSQGALVYDAGLSSTPAMFMGTVFEETAFDAAIMITASHLPKNRNGMKFFTRDGGLDKPDIKKLLQMAGDTPCQGVRKCEKSELMSLYASFLRDRIIRSAGLGDKPLDGLHIVVDAGNGSGGFFVKDVIEPLGADCEGSRFLEPDGNFPNHQPNPENKEAMASIRQAVLDSGADIGIIFDTDVDRMSVVFSNGDEISRNAIIALMAAVLAPEYPDSTIVTDSVTSDNLTGFLEGLGLKHHCFKRGYKNVINEAIRLNNDGITSPLAIETSGHGALKENYFLDDGAYMAVRILSAAAKARAKGEKLDSLLRDFVRPAFEQEIRLPISAEDFSGYGGMVLKKFKQNAEQQGIDVVKSYEGVRLKFSGKGWAMLRMSLHDPIMPLNLESATGEGLSEIKHVVSSLMSEFDCLDLTNIN